MTDWLLEERLDKTRRRRVCLGCGERQEFAASGPAPSYVAWVKAHRGCGEAAASAVLAAADGVLTAFTAPAILATPFDAWAGGFDAALLDALHRADGEQGIWQSLRREGADQDDLRAALGTLFAEAPRTFPWSQHLTGAHRGGPDWAASGGYSPRFWFACDPASDKPSLAGPALVSRARELLGIPWPERT